MLSFFPNIQFYLFVFKRFLSGGILKRGKFISFKELFIIIRTRSSIRQKSKNFFSIFVEANPKIVKKKNFYPNAEMLFNIALTENMAQPISIAKLYVGNNDLFGEGSSIFKDKYGNLHQNYLPTLGVESQSFFYELALYLNKKFSEYDVLLRLNCEGVEDNVIYSAHKSFGKRLSLICGSLKDVEELKGKDAAKQLESFMNDNNLPFIKFSSGINTWPQAHSVILDLLNKNSKK